MKSQIVYKSAIGKLYQEVQENLCLDKIVIELYTLLEFEIKTGQKLPIFINAEVVRGKSSKEIEYIQNSLYDLGCKGEFLFEKKPDGKIEFVLVDLV
jgi:hypothetical protein